MYGVRVCLGGFTLLEPSRRTSLHSCPGSCRSKRRWRADMDETEIDRREVPLVKRKRGSGEVRTVRVSRGRRPSLATAATPPPPAFEPCAGLTRLFQSLQEIESRRLLRHSVVNRVGICVIGADCAGCLY